MTVVLHVPQDGSTRSINAGVASGIAMYEWVRGTPTVAATDRMERVTDDPGLALEHARL